MFEITQKYFFLLKNTKVDDEIQKYFGKLYFNGPLSRRNTIINLATTCLSA